MRNKQASLKYYPAACARPSSEYQLDSAARGRLSCGLWFARGRVSLASGLLLDLKLCPGFIFRARSGQEVP